MKAFHITCLVLVVVGAINWGLVGLFDFDLVAALLGGEDQPLSRLVYSLVGLAGIGLALTSATYLSGRSVAFDRGRRVST